MHVQSHEPLEVEKFAVILDEVKYAVEALFEKEDTMEEELKYLQEKLEELQELEVDILIGQLAVSVEEEIVKYILKGTGISTCYIMIRNIDDALRCGYEHDSCSKDIFTSREQEDKAKQNKAKLSADFPSINGGMYCSIEYYKQTRNIRTHPKLHKIITRLGQLGSQHIEDEEMVDKMIQIAKAFKADL